MASAGFEPTNLGTKGQHATSRPLKPIVVSYGKIFVKIQHMILYVISMTSNVDMATMSICNSDKCSCYYKHSLELISTVVIFSFHFGSEITC